MSKYIEQYDFPSYPNEKPQPNSRTICGIGRGEFMEPDKPGFHVMIGGCGGGRVPTIQAGRDLIYRNIVDVCIERMAEALRVQAYYRDRLEALGGEERNLVKWQVKPDV